MLLLIFYICILQMPKVHTILPQYAPVNRDLGRNETIVNYFRLGFTAVEILGFLASIHGFRLSLRQLRRILRNNGCTRREDPTDLNAIVLAVEQQLRGSGRLLGYRAMHQRLVNDYHFVVTRDVVRRVLRVLDPDGVEARSRHRLRRRSYHTKGPNYLWHIDGYDKLKPFGFCVHGAIDGYSRKVIWLEVANSNNNPRIVVQYYLDYARQIGGVPRIVRGDRGTENVHVEVIQRFFHRSARDDFSGEKSFMYGRSVANQRIEAWWSMLRKQCTDWWIKYFKDLRDRGLFSDDDIIQRECLKFCFMEVLQKELHKIAQHWNTHRIRPSANPESPPGRPDILYFLPQSADTYDYATPVGLDEIEIAEGEFAETPPPRGCSNYFHELAEMIMQDERLDMPETAAEAENLYITLLNLINDLSYI